MKLNSAPFRQNSSFSHTGGGRSRGGDRLGGGQPLRHHQRHRTAGWEMKNRLRPFLAMAPPILIFDLWSTASSPTPWPHPHWSLTFHLPSPTLIFDLQSQLLFQGSTRNALSASTNHDVIRPPFWSLISDVCCLIFDLWFLIFQIYYAFEESECCERQFCKQRRTFCLHIVDNFGKVSGPKIKDQLSTSSPFCT